MTNEPLKKVRCKKCHDEFFQAELENGVCVDCELTQRKKEKYELRKSNKTSK